MSDVLANAHSIPDGLPWALIGPTGVTGRMILERALALGYRPRLIGRDPAKLAALAAPSQLDWVAVDLRDRTALQQALAGQRLVLNAAGPFATTAPLVIAAALGAGIDYLDLNGELSALEAMFEQDAAARSAGVALVGGVGFGIAASDGLAMQVSARLGGAEWMRIAVAADSGFGSPAVAESTVAVIAGGGREVRAGAIVRRKLARGRWRETGPDGIRHPFASAPLADLAAARRATGTRRIIAGVPMAHNQARLLSVIAPLLPTLLKLPPVRRAMAQAGGACRCCKNGLPVACMDHGRTGEGNRDCQARCGRGLCHHGRYRDGSDRVDPRAASDRWRSQPGNRVRRRLYQRNSGYLNPLWAIEGPTGMHRPGPNISAIRSEIHATRHAKIAICFPRDNVAKAAARPATGDRRRKAGVEQILDLEAQAIAIL